MKRNQGKDREKTNICPKGKRKINILDLLNGFAWNRFQEREFLLYLKISSYERNRRRQRGLFAFLLGFISEWSSGVLTCLRPSQSLAQRYFTDRTKASGARLSCSDQDQETKHTTRIIWNACFLGFVICLKCWYFPVYMNVETSHSVAAAQTDLTNLHNLTWNHPSQNWTLDATDVTLVGPVLHLLGAEITRPGLACTDHGGLKNIVLLALLFSLIQMLCVCSKTFAVRFEFCLFVFKTLPSQAVLFPEMYLSCTWKKAGRGGAGWHLLNYYILQNRLPVVSVCTL